MSWSTVNPFPNGVQKLTAGSNITVTGTVQNPTVSASSGGISALTAGSNITLSGTSNVTISAASGMYVNVNAWIANQTVTVVPNTIYNCIPNQTITLNAQSTAWSDGDFCWIINYIPGSGPVTLNHKTGSTTFYYTSYLMYSAPNHTFFYYSPPGTSQYFTN